MGDCRGFATIALTMSVLPVAAMLHEKPAVADDARRRTADGKALPDGMRLGDMASVRTETVQVYLWNLPTGTDYEMVYVPPGDFTMGLDEVPEQGQETFPLHPASKASRRSPARLGISPCPRGCKLNASGWSWHPSWIRLHPMR